MKIIQHADCFEVRSERGSFVKRFPFDDNVRRRAISRRMTRKQAFQAAKAFAGKSYTVETAKPWQDWNFAGAGQTARPRKGQRSGARWLQTQIEAWEKASGCLRKA